MIAQFMSSGKPKAYLFLFLGQSNMLQQHDNINALPESYFDPQPLIQMWSVGTYGHIVAGHFEAMQIPDNTRDPQYSNPASMFYNITSWGAEQPALHAFQSHYGTTIFGIKSAIGATNSTYWSNTAGFMWLQLVDYFTSAVEWLESQGYEVVVPAMLWVQYESDVIEGIVAGYAASMATFLANFRALSTKLANTKIIFSKPSADQTGIDATGRGIVTGVFQSFVDADPVRYGMINTDDLITQPDKVHYTSASGIILGQRFGELALA